MFLKQYMWPENWRTGQTEVSVDPLTVRFLLLFVPAPILPALSFFLAISDQIGGAIIAGIFSLINTVLLAVLTVRISRSRRNGHDVESDSDDERRTPSGVSGNQLRPADVDSGPSGVGDEGS